MEKPDFYIDFSKNKEVEKQYIELIAHLKKKYLDAISEEET